MPDCKVQRLPEDPTAGKQVKETEKVATEDSAWEEIGKGIIYLFLFFKIWQLNELQWLIRIKTATNTTTP